MKSYMDYVKDKTRITNNVLVPTGFMYFDYHNGKRHVVYDDDERPLEIHDSIGEISGSINTITGKSTTGKTTFALQLAQAILNPFIYSVLNNEYVENPKIDGWPLLEIYDVENKFDISMASRAMSMPTKAMKNIIYIYRDRKDNEIMERVMRHIEYKEKNMKKVKYKFKDLYGNNIETYPPSCILIDSMNQVESSRVENFADMTANMTGMSRAKSVQNMFTDLSTYCSKYNITIFIIQHILSDVQTGFLSKAKQFRGLKKDEKFGGGEKGILLSSNIIRLEHVNEIGTEKKSYENMGTLKGFLTKCTIIKSSTNVINSSFHLINLADTGYNRLMSTFYEACVRGDLEEPKKGWYTIKGAPNKLLNNRNFLQEVEKDFNLANLMYYELRDKLRPLLSSSDKSKTVAKPKANKKDEGPDLLALTMMELGFDEEA